MCSVTVSQSVLQTGIQGIMCMNDDTLTIYNWQVNWSLVSTLEIHKNYRVCKHNVDVDLRWLGCTMVLVTVGHQVSGRPQPRTVDMVEERNALLYFRSHDEVDALRITGEKQGGTVPHC